MVKRPLGPEARAAPFSTKWKKIFGASDAIMSCFLCNHAALFIIEKTTHVCIFPCENGTYFQLLDGKTLSFVDFAKKWREAENDACAFIERTCPDAGRGAFFSADSESA
ncbi:MAG: hypothetical protein J5556_07410 [Deltaproteobacteria bacterium]|nr:hypothetical protein [Deltaproteobacteria bacterium]